MTTHKAWRLHAPNDLRFDEVDTAPAAPDGVLVRIEAAAMLSYMDKIIAGTLPYALPPMPFVPGTNAVGRVVEAGAQVSHVRPGDLVFLSPHLRADVPDAEPPQILIGLTAMGGGQAAQSLQGRWRDGVFAEIAHWPGACVTPLPGLDDRSVTELLGLAKLVVPFGGLQRLNLRGGQTVVINGAAGYFGAGAVLLAVAMGAGRIIAVGRRREALQRLAEALGPRVIPAVVNGDDTARDTATIRHAACGGADVALDLLGQASSTSTTLSTLRALRRGGRLVLMGSATAPLPLSFAEMLANDWEVVGQFMYERTAPGELATLARERLLDLSRIVVTSFALAELPRAVEAAALMQGLDLTALVP
ncbi:alcohol dehydrogenase, zinc-binding [Bradyrhizobium oligotrophicum S58]|uniref:Alcohol dehydrogenase, zinc-binding n=1 Tax=Bradyrhizobium oligotrophicum S58 TaxID=1245469 RepID=M4ZJD2_9BRAD|nr:zinc-binding alcohol dehydrogenase family protein [Bradyrhizobium oligotrophicum]BAM86400.1 alcohol dehydrogenase, zinc-binding [Bradyrhizobium oligotrophicum S58]